MWLTRSLLSPSRRPPGWLWRGPWRRGHDPRSARSRRRDFEAYAHEHEGTGTGTTEMLARPSRTPTTKRKLRHFPYRDSFQFVSPPSVGVCCSAVAAGSISVSRIAHSESALPLAPLTGCLQERAAHHSCSSIRLGIRLIHAAQRRGDVDSCPPCTHASLRSQERSQGRDATRQDVPACLSCAHHMALLRKRRLLGSSKEAPSRGKRGWLCLRCKVGMTLQAIARQARQITMWLC